MKNVLLVFGGESYEHDISIVTAFQILKKSRLDNYKLIPFYVSRDGKFFVCDENKIKISDLSKNNFNGKKKGIKEVVLVSAEKQKIFEKTRFGLREFACAELAIFACHGGEGENGKLVSFFDRHGIACSVGSPDALAICMDKFLFKTIAKGLKIPVVRGFKVSKQEVINDEVKILRKVKQMKFPVVLKINSGGSSIGLFVANDEDELKEKFQEAFDFNDDVIIEKFIQNTREFNIAIVGDSEKYEVSEIDEPLKNNDVLTFADKYLSGESAKSGGVKNSKGSMDLSVRRIPVDLPDEIKNSIKAIAEKIFVKLGLYGVVRIDFLFDEKTNKIYVCEVNAIPGSLAFYFFKKNKIIVNDLVEKLINIAERNYKKFNIRQDFIVNLLDKNNSWFKRIIFFILLILFCKKKWLLYNYISNNLEGFVWIIFFIVVQIMICLRKLCVLQKMSQ